MSQKLILQAVEPFRRHIEGTKWFEQNFRSYCSSAFLTASLCIVLAAGPMVIVNGPSPQQAGQTKLIFYESLLSGSSYLLPF